MAGLIGELIGQLLLFNIILQHSLWVENTVDFFFLLFGIIFLPRWNENITLQQCFICYWVIFNFFSKLKYFVNFSQKLISGSLWVSALVFRLTFVVWIEFERKLNSGIDIPITTTKIVFLHNLSIVNNKFTFGLALQSSTLVN